MLTRKDFLDTVVSIVFRDHCSYTNAIRKACQELQLNAKDFIRLGGH